MVARLPPELLALIQQRCPCRETQIRLLATSYNNILPSPPLLVAYGLEHSSKRETIRAVLEARGIPNAFIKSTECLTQKHLLSKIFASCLTALGRDGRIEEYEKIDSINALLGNLRRLFQRGDQKFVVVIEDADNVRQAGATLLAALARLGDLVPGFSVIFTIISSRTLNLHKAGVPYIHFPPYSRSEAISIITLRLKSPVPAELQRKGRIDVDETVLLSIYPQFAATVYDSLISSTSSTSINAFQSACDRLWPRFVKPLVSPSEITGSAKPWTFSRLLVLHRNLFQAEGESILHTNFTPPRAPSVDHSAVQSLSPPPDASSHQPPLLKHFATLVLISAYLASHTQQQHDVLLFSRMSSSSSSRKKVRKSRQTPTKKSAPNTTRTPPNAGITPSKPRAKSVFAANANLGVARPFTTERLIAILRAIHPHGVASGRGISDRICRELGELEKLRLVVRVSGPGGSSAAGEDASEEKWRVNVSRDWVVTMAEVWGMSVGEYEIDQDV